MSAPQQPGELSKALNRLQQLAPAPLNRSSSLHSQMSQSPGPTGWSSQSPSLPPNAVPAPAFTHFSATTAEILNRIKAGSSAHTTGTPAFEAKRAEVLQNYMTSDKLPTPPPITNNSRRGRGGRIGTSSHLKTDASESPAAGATPTSGRGSGRGRPRGRGRGGGRGGKRKRSESFDDSENDSDISVSYTPQITRTKSGRNVNKPVVFVPTIPEPTRENKRRRATKSVLAAQCSVCHRGTDPTNNRIVFCDMCNTAYHQYCHNPPIDNEVVNVLEKEFLCGPCERSKRTVVQGTEDLIAGSGLSIDDVCSQIHALMSLLTLDYKRLYLSTLPHVRLVSLLLHASIRHPELPLFPPDIDDLLPELRSKVAQPQPKIQTATTTIISKPTSVPISANQPASTSRPHASPANGHAHPSASPSQNTPRSQNLTIDGSDLDPAEAQLLGEIRRSRRGDPTSQPQAQQTDEYDDGYDIDPPAHYPKPGHGLARTLPPEEDDEQWMVDDNFEVFSHGWKGDGSGMGADADANANGQAGGMQGFPAVQGRSSGTSG